MPNGISIGVDINYESALTHINMLSRRISQCQEFDEQILNRSVKLLNEINKIIQLLDLKRSK